MPQGLHRRRFLKVGAAAAAMPVGALPSAATARDVRGLDALGRDLRGRLLRPGDSGYAYAAWPNNARWAEVRPSAIAMCAGPADVQACIAWARQEDRPFAVRSGGHSYAGFSTTEGLLIDVKPMNRVAVDLEAGLVTVAGGASNQDMADALRSTGHAVPSGRCPTVGTSGLVLGGGWGFSATHFGLTCDSLRATEVVTADGLLRRASEVRGENSDLFWAARGGGGGNFGVHTDFTFALDPVGHVTTFNIAWPAERQVEVMLALQRIQRDNATMLSTRSKIAPAHPGVPDRRDLRAQTLGIYWGTPEDLRQVMAPAFSVLKPDLAQINHLDYWSARDYLATDDPTGLYDMRSSYVRDGLTGEALETMLAWMTRWPGGSVRQDNLGILFAVGGRVKDRRPTDTAYVHREADFIFEMETSWAPIDPPDVVARQQAWLAEYFAAMQTFVTPRSYVNFPSRDLPNWARAYYGENLERLQAIKRQVDPGNAFRFPQSIPPASATARAESALR